VTANPVITEGIAGTESSKVENTQAFNQAHFDCSIVSIDDPQKSNLRG
jgi:hypothetical protein